MSASILYRGDGRVPTDWSEWHDVNGMKWRRVYGSVFGCTGMCWHTQRWCVNHWTYAEGGTSRPLTCTKKTTRSERMKARTEANLKWELYTKTKLDTV